MCRDYGNTDSAFYSNGGITVTGGEPLLQIDFLLELFQLASGKGIHTCLDTSGVTYRENDSLYRQKLNRLMDLTNLVMLDIKHIDDTQHRKLTGHGNTDILRFARYLEKKKIPVWIRHVVVPGITDHADDLRNLGHMIGTLSNVKALDVLPYHTMGIGKYDMLGMKYPLEGIDALPKEKAVQAKQLILEGIRDVRNK